MQTIAWNFDPHVVTCSLSVSATFHPSIGSACISLPWFDPAGALSSILSFGALSSWDSDRSGHARGSRAGAVTARSERDLGELPVTLELVQLLRSAVLPVTLKVPGAAGDVAVPSAARLHLGPLLLATGSKAAAAAPADQEQAHSELMRPVRPSEVLATFTDTVGLAGLYHLHLRLSTSAPILTPQMQDYLKPICFTVDALRGLPNEAWLPEKCDDVYVEVYPQLSRATACLAGIFSPVRSASRPHDANVKLLEPIVWLMGLAPPHAIREWLQHEGLVVEVHDRDARAGTGAVAEDGGAAEAKGAAAGEELGSLLDRLPDVGKRKFHPHGVARFLLGSILESRTLQVALRGDVVPGRSDKKRRRAEAMSQGLHASSLLEEEGAEKVAFRAKFDAREDTTDYHAMGTVCTIHAMMAVPFPDAASISASADQLCQQQWAACEKRLSQEGNIWVASSEGSDGVQGAPREMYRVKLHLADGTEVSGPWRQSKDKAEADDLRFADAAKAQESQRNTAIKAVADELRATSTESIDGRFERFGRIVLVLDETETQLIYALLQHVLTWNAMAKGLNPSSAEVHTYQLTPEEKANPNFDFISGFGVLDGQSRTFVLEGLRGRGLEDLVRLLGPGSRLNTSRSKILYNADIGFSTRLYADFGSLKLKQIKIREPLEQIATKPDLYSISGVASDDTIAGTQAVKLLMELKQMARLRALRKGSAFPKVIHLLNLELLYGGFVTDAELEGLPPTRSTAGGALAAPKTPVIMKSTAAAKSKADLLEETMPHQTCLEQAIQTLEPANSSPAELGKSGRSRKAALQMQNPVFDGTMKLRGSASMPNFTQTNRDAVKQQSDENMRLNDIQGKKRTPQAPFLEGQQVFPYSGQKLASTELQKEWMRKHMDPQQKGASWTYNEVYNSQAFEFSGAQPPGKQPHVARCPGDTQARLEGDNRPIWRNPPARPSEEFRKPERNVDAARREELHEAFVENEWQRLPVGDERCKPVSVQGRFDPDKVPHHRQKTERPFDATHMQTSGADFGPKAGYESVHYHGRQPAESRYEEPLRHNMREREKASAKDQGKKPMRSFSQGATRMGVTDKDRYEPMLKDPPALQLRGKLDGPMPVTIRNDEEYHEAGNPGKEWQARLRENDGSPPFDVNSGTYLKRDLQVGTGDKRACMSGTRTKAPWQHGSDKESSVQGTQYPASKDFNLTRQPPKSRVCENQIWKNASRAAIHEEERSYLPYRRPVDYGVAL